MVCAREICRTNIMICSSSSGIRGFFFVTLDIRRIIDMRLKKQVLGYIFRSAAIDPFVLQGLIFLELKCILWTFDVGPKLS